MPYTSPAQRAAVWAKRNREEAAWNDVITKGNALTKKDVHEYYSNPVITQRMLAALANKDILTVQSRSPEKQIVRRYRKKDVPYVVKNPDDLSYLTSRRHTEFHPTIGEKTKDVWVDIDPGKNVSTDALKPTVKSVAAKLKGMPGVQNVSIAFSGGKGFHVRGVLDKEQPTRDLRTQLIANLEKLQKDNAQLTLKPPHKDQVRLDVSTYHTKGSLRAPYSLNAKTGLVSVPLSLNQLTKFNPAKDATPKEVLRRTEFAPGIPSERKTHDLPVFDKPKTWTLAVQKHDAKRAGKHWDVRLVDPQTSHAHSFAVPKSQFPEGNKPLLAIRTPTHTARYALTFGEGKPKTIGKGYGRGTVELLHKEPIRVLSSEPNKIKFERTVDGTPEKYMMFKTKGTSWLMRKLGQDRIYEEGRQAMLQKLGASTKYVQSEPSNTEVSRPMEVGDEHAPAGQLASAMAQLPTPTDREDSSGNSSADIEGRLNRSTRWSAPESVPLEFAEGSSTIIPGTV